MCERVCNDGVRLDLEKFALSARSSPRRRELHGRYRGSFRAEDEDLKFAVPAQKSSCRDNAVGRAFVREAGTPDERTMYPDKKVRREGVGSPQNKNELLLSREI